MEVKLEIMLNAAVKLCQGKHIVMRLMLTKKYSCFYNGLKLFCLHTHNKMTKKYFLVSNYKYTWCTERLLQGFNLFHQY